MQFAQRFRDLREDHEPQITQGQLGKILGMSQRKVSALERNETEPNLSDIIAICKYFKVSSDYLLGLTSKL